VDTPAKADNSWQGAFKVLAFLFVLWLVIEVIAISVLGSNSNNTFTTVPKTIGNDAANRAGAPAGAR
jgi:hypothetical protein